MMPNIYNMEQQMRDEVKHRWAITNQLPAEASPVRIARLLRALAVEEPAVWHHGQRVAWFAIRIGGGLEIDRAQMYLAGLLHDLGKLALPASILDKPGALTPGEQQRMRLHPTLGAALLPAGPGLLAVHLGVRHHHEQWDGSGYPDGLRGIDIPLPARIIAIADALDAICMDRPYRPRRSFPAALDIVAQGAGRQFDPDLVAAMLRVFGSATAHSQA
jgi:HD-GYP domain-containing protein (c-di-GMP phosphodiesterase class II)